MTSPYWEPSPLSAEIVAAMDAASRAKGGPGVTCVNGRLVHANSPEATATARADSAQSTPREANEFTAALSGILAAPEVPVVYRTPRLDADRYGLLQRNVVDRTGRVMTEFVCAEPDGQKLWMRPFQSPVNVMAKLTTTFTGDAVADGLAADRAVDRFFEFQAKAAKIQKVQR
jgi:hypothetical protein